MAKRRYIPVRATRDPRGWDPLLPNVIVFEPEFETRRTGLYDKHGNELMFVPEPRQIGFVVLKESEKDTTAMAKKPRPKPPRKPRPGY